MRTLRRLSALALVMLAAACNDTPTTSGAGRMIARFDGRTWAGDAEVIFVRDTVVLRTTAPMDPNRASFSSETGSWRELVLYVVASAPGEYRVVTEKSRYAEIIGGDVRGYSADVTAGTIRFTTLRRGEQVAAGRVNDVRIEGSSGVWSFDEGGFTAEVREF